jgi:hypothetical protein
MQPDDAVSLLRRQGGDLRDGQGGRVSTLRRRPEVVVAATPEPGDRLAALARVYVAFAVAEPDAYRIMFELAQNDDTKYPELETQSHRAWAPLRDAVGAAVGAGLIAGDPEDVAHLYWAQVHGLVALHLAGKLTLGRSLGQLLEVMLGADTERRTTSC